LLYNTRDIDENFFAHIEQATQFSFYGKVLHDGSGQALDNGPGIRQLLVKQSTEFI